MEGIWSGVGVDKGLAHEDRLGGGEGGENELEEGTMFDGDDQEVLAEFVFI